jgi:hypothetical protein
MGKKNLIKEEKQVQYLGESGKTNQCFIALSAILNSGCLPKSVTVVTFTVIKGKQLIEHHLFIFWDWGRYPVTIVPSAFTSGYEGAGPEAFSLALCMISSKKIPMFEYYTRDGNEFADLDEGKIQNPNNHIYQEMKKHDGWSNCLRDAWVNKKHKNMLERGQIWRAYYWYTEQKCDSITEAISNIDLFNSGVGKKLRLANDKIKNGIQTEDWQETGVLIRDSWIELSQKLCEFNKIDTSSIEKDKVMDKLRKLNLNEKILSLAKSCFDLSSKVHHDRNITQEVAMACVESSIFTMQSLTSKYTENLYLKFE